MKPISRSGIAKRAAADLRSGQVVNLGVGIPSEICGLLDENFDVLLHSENGIVGIGGIASNHDSKFDLVNANRQPVYLRNGAAILDHVDSFSLIRGGHIDVALLGAYQVSLYGDLASYSKGTRSDPPSPGGAMDLAVGAKTVRVMMNLFGPNDSPKLLQSCSFPLTAKRVVSTIYTDYAVFEISGGKCYVTDLINGMSVSDLIRLLDVDIIASPTGVVPYRDIV